AAVRVSGAEEGYEQRIARECDGADEYETKQHDRDPRACVGVLQLRPLALCRNGVEQVLGVRAFGGARAHGNGRTRSRGRRGRGGRGRGGGGGGGEGGVGAE